MCCRQILLIYIKFSNTSLYPILIVVFEKRSSLFLVIILNGHPRSEHHDLEVCCCVLNCIFSSQCASAFISSPTNKLNYKSPKFINVEQRHENNIYPRSSNLEADNLLIDIKKILLIIYKG